MRWSQLHGDMQGKHGAHEDVLSAAGRKAGSTVRLKIVALRGSNVTVSIWLYAGKPVYPSGTRRIMLA
jgi:hypothetical protein